MISHTVNHLLLVGHQDPRPWRFPDHGRGFRQIEVPQTAVSHSEGGKVLLQINSIVQVKQPVENTPFWIYTENDGVNNRHCRS